jgi:pyruvate ferredoxin oxidoreductase beta subunit
VTEYLRLQSRFRHLFEREGGDERIAAIQALADDNVARYELEDKK